MALALRQASAAGEDSDMDSEESAPRGLCLPPYVDLLLLSPLSVSLSLQSTKSLLLKSAMYF